MIYIYFFESKYLAKWKECIIYNVTILYDSCFCVFVYWSSNVLIELNTDMKMVKVVSISLCLSLSCSWRSRASPCVRLRGLLVRGCVSTCSGSSSTCSFCLYWAEPSTSSTSPPKHHRTRWGFDAYSMSLIWWVDVHFWLCFLEWAPLVGQSGPPVPASHHHHLCQPAPPSHLPQDLIFWRLLFHHAGQCHTGEVRCTGI